MNYEMMNNNLGPDWSENICGVIYMLNDVTLHTSVGKINRKTDYNSFVRAIVMCIAFRQRIL